MTDSIRERAQDLGRMLGQSDEYKALKRARDGLGEDRAAVEAMNRLDAHEHDVAVALHAGREPADEVKAEYERLFGSLQSLSAYQSMVAAQSNFDKLLGRVNEEITRGMETGAQSRIIMPS
jgi:cell fate (sporulation/competence/biofilm development) regulator YlbF (YheA/YmcA/DUF963 family)